MEFAYLDRYLEEIMSDFDQLPMKNIKDIHSIILGLKNYIDIVDVADTSLLELVLKFDIQLTPGLPVNG